MDQTVFFASIMLNFAISYFLAGVTIFVLWRFLRRRQMRKEYACIMRKLAEYHDQSNFWIGEANRLLHLMDDAQEDDDQEEYERLCREYDTIDLRVQTELAIPVNELQNEMREFSIRYKRNLSTHMVPINGLKLVEES